MKFTMNIDYKTAYGNFEAENTHDSEKLGIPDECVNEMYQCGACEIEGMDKAPEVTINNVKLQPKKVVQSNKAGGA